MSWSAPPIIATRLSFPLGRGWEERGGGEEEGWRADHPANRWPAVLPSPPLVRLPPPPSPRPAPLSPLPPRRLPQSCQLASPCCRELGPRRCTRRRARACCGCRCPLSCRWSPELARAAPRGRAHGSTARLPFTPGACLSPQWRPRPFAPAAPRRDAPSGQPDQARHGGVGRPGLTPARAPSSWVCAPA